MTDEHCRLTGWQDRQMSAQGAAALIAAGMTVGMSGFTLAGEAKEVPLALARRAVNDPVSITLMTGASLGNDIDARLTDAGVIARRLPFQVDATLRQAINEGRVMFIDERLSEIVERLRHGDLGHMDVAIIEACAITKDGGIVPTTSVGNSATFAELADKVIVELNQAAPDGLEGLHDIHGNVNSSHMKRARAIIDHCADPLYRDALDDYFSQACKGGGQTPHCLEKAFSWHTALASEGSMRAVTGSADADS